MAGKSDIKAGSAFVELFVKGAKFEVGLKKAAKQLKEFGDGLTSIGTKIAGIGAAGLTGLGAAVKSFADSGDELGKMALRTGMSVKALSELRYAASQSGASIDDVEKAAKRMAVVLHDAATGSASAAASLAEVGLSIDDLAGMSPDEQFNTIAMALAKVEDASTKAALAQKLFGKSGTMLLPLFSEGEKGMAALREEAAKLGVTMEQEDADAATNLGDAFDRVKAAASGIANAIGSALAPVLTDLANDIAFTVAESIKWIRANRELVVAIAKGMAIVTAIGGAIAGLGLVISTAGTAISGLATLFGGLLTAATALATPIGLVTAAIVALAAVIVSATGILPKLVDQFKPLVGAIKEIAISLASGDFKKAWDVAATSVKYFGSVALDIFTSLPEYAAYAAGAVARAIIDGFKVAWEWVKSMPSMIDAMLFGDASIGETIDAAMKAAAAKLKSIGAAAAAGFAGEAMPGMGESDRTKALRDRLRELTGDGGAFDAAAQSRQGKGKAGAADAARKAALTGKGGPLSARGAGTGDVFSTFSAAALIASTFGGASTTGPEEKMLSKMEAELVESKKMVKILGDLLDEARRSRLVFG